MAKTLTKIFTGLLSFLIGVPIAWFTGQHMRNLIINSYQWTTGNAIQFYGKYVIFNLDPFYYIIFGITTLTLWICFKNLNLKGIAAWVSLSSILFLATLTVFALIDGNYRVISCTMCDEGIVNLHWNDLNYNFITEFGLLVAITPLVVMTIVNKKVSQQTKLS